MKELIIRDNFGFSELKDGIEKELKRVDEELVKIEDKEITSEEERLDLGRTIKLENGNIKTSKDVISEAKKEVIKTVFGEVEDDLSKLNTKRAKLVSTMNAKNDEFVTEQTKLKKIEVNKHLNMILRASKLTTDQKYTEIVSNFVDQTAYKYNTTKSKSEKLVNDCVIRLKEECEEFGITLEEYYEHRFNPTIYSKSLVTVAKTAENVRYVPVNHVENLKDAMGAKKTTQTTWLEYLDKKVIKEIDVIVKGMNLSHSETKTLVKLIEERI